MIASNPATGLWRKRAPGPTPTPGRFAVFAPSGYHRAANLPATALLARPGRWRRVLVTRGPLGQPPGCVTPGLIAKASKGRPSLRFGWGASKSLICFAQYTLCKPYFADLLAFCPRRRGARASELTDLVTLAMGDDAPSRAIIWRMVSTIDSDIHRPRQKSFDELPPPPVADQADEDGPAYLDPDNLPPDVGLVRDLAVKHEITTMAIHAWIRRGRMAEVGRVRGKAGGHGGFVAVFEADVLHCLSNPRKGGRPKKQPV